ncbi:hypothetical protein IEO21_03138 [Rhodonia placenta]|uniref:Uncharacterized protein n=1 Tax=Rhodonia placenta TaxID=104341 RepID=A0A8H7P6H6_9APHY|nr:hypothetical protein IEO21_03138 [Postia placenta]
MRAFGYVLMLCSFAVTNILAAPALNARAMPTLYRSGNAGGPRLDNVRPQDLVMDNGKVSTTAGGMSTFDYILNDWKTKSQLKNVWVLPGEAELTALNLVAIHDNDPQGHWSIRPKVAMTTDEFKVKLAELNGKCTKRPLTAEEEASFKKEKGKRTIEDLFAALERRGFEDLLTRFVRPGFGERVPHISRYDPYPYVARRSDVFAELPRSELDARDFDGGEWY